MKTCPFCGSKGRMQSYQSWRGSWARVMCSNKACAARGPTVRRHVVETPKHSGDITRAELKAWAERSWNERVACAAGDAPERVL